MILELTTDEHLVVCSLVDAGLSDYAVICQMFSLFGMQTRIVDQKEVFEAISGGITA